MKITRTTLPAGEYWIGDPCYVIEPHSVWLELVDEFYGDRREIDHDEVRIVEYKGQRMVWSPTDYGDGVYYGSNGYSYGVDAGLLGVVPTELICEGSTEAGYREKGSSTGTLHTFEYDFEVVRTENHVQFGDLEIMVGEETCGDCGDLHDEYESCDAEDYCDTCEVHYFVDGWETHDDCEDNEEE